MFAGAPVGRDVVQDHGLAHARESTNWTEVVRAVETATRELRLASAAVARMPGQKATFHAIPEPEQFTRAKARYAASYPDLPPPIWPLNREKLEGLMACFDRPYRVAYTCNGTAEVQ